MIDCPPEARAFHEAYRAREAAAHPTGAFDRIGDVMPDALTADRLWAHREAKAEGMAVAEAGLPDVNPYRLGSVARHGWGAGWRMGDPARGRPKQTSLFG